MDKILCPKCGSDQFTADKHGFSAGKALMVGAVTGGVGLLAGFHGSKKIDITCLKCGNVFRPGDKPIAKTPPPKYGKGIWIFTALIWIAFFIVLFVLIAQRWK